MANHVSAAKRARQTLKITERNKHFRTTTRTHVKRVRAAITAGDKSKAAEALQAIRRAEPAGRLVRVSGTDPLNLTGVVLPGDRVPARSTGWFDLPV